MKFLKSNGINLKPKGQPNVDFKLYYIKKEIRLRKIDPLPYMQSCMGS